MLAVILCLLKPIPTAKTAGSFAIADEYLWEYYSRPSIVNGYQIRVLFADSEVSFLTHLHCREDHAYES
jgi:hypothetical protein